MNVKVQTSWIYVIQIDCNNNKSPLKYHYIFNIIKNHDNPNLFVIHLKFTVPVTKNLDVIED